MAIHATDTTSASRPAPGADPQQTYQDQGQAPGPRASTGSNLFDRMNALQSTMSLGPDIEKYLNEIQEYFKNSMEPSLQPRRVRLNEPQGAHVYILGDVALALIFASKLTRYNENFAPASDSIMSVKRAMIDQFGEPPPRGKGPRLLNAILVGPEDLPRSSQMAQHISTTLRVATSAEFNGETVGIMSGMRFRIDPDVNAAKQLIDDQSPHGVQSRVDIGFVLYAAVQRNNMMPGDADQMRALAAVGGYTEILAIPTPPTMEIRYTPVVHITEIAAAFPIAGIVPLCIALAAEQFIGHRMWQNPFTTFQKGASKPNLGMLSPDPNDPSKLWFANDMDDLEKWGRFNMSNASYLALDVVDGRARIPEVVTFGYADLAPYAYDIINNFFGSRTTIPPAQELFRVQAESFIGTVGAIDGKLRDSRELDYLNLVASSGPQDANTKRLLLSYPRDPAERARAMAALTANNFRSLYRAQVSVFDGRLLAALTSVTKNSMQIQSPTQAQQMIATDWLVQQAPFYTYDQFSVSTPPNQRGWGQPYAGGGLFMPFQPR